MFMGATVVCIVVIASDVGNEGNGHGGGSILVSYTHLTLPTKRIV